MEQCLGPRRQRMQALQQSRRCSRLAERLDRGTVSRECIARQIDRVRLAVALTQQFGLEQVEIAELVFFVQRRVVGDIVGSPDKIVERQDQRPMARMNDPRRNRKILVAVSLAGSQFACARHLTTGYIRWNNGSALSGVVAHAKGSRTPYRGIRR